MYINYLLLAHKNLAQVDRLIANLLNDHTYVYIHIDKGVSMVEIKRHRFATEERVKIIRNRIAVSWGGFSMVRATLNLMRTAAKHGKPGYCVLMSGQDFPLQSSEAIHSFFLANRGKEYMQYWRLPYNGWVNGGLDRIKYYWFVDKIGMYNSDLFVSFQKDNKMERAYFRDFPPYGGSQWWCLTLNCVNYILDFIERHPIVVDFFELTLIPDESFFTTIVLNSPLKERVVNDNLRYIVFEGGKPHPNLISSRDFSALIESKQFWARKFDMTYDSLILDRLENHIGAWVTV